jgi:hypothetical protein
VALAVFTVKAVNVGIGTKEDVESSNASGSRVTCSTRASGLGSGETGYL